MTIVTTDGKRYKGDKMNKNERQFVICCLVFLVLIVFGILVFFSINTVKVREETYNEAFSKGYEQGKIETEEACEALYGDSTPKLHPCPLCGHEVSLESTSGGKYWYIECYEDYLNKPKEETGCGLRTSSYTDKYELIKLWNDMKGLN